MFVTYVVMLMLTLSKTINTVCPRQTGSGVWSRIELMVGKNGQYWQQSSFTNLTKFFPFILSNTNISDIHECYYVLPNLQKILYVFAWLQRISLGGFRVFFYVWKCFVICWCGWRCLRPIKCGLWRPQVVIKRPPVPQTSLLENEQTFKKK